MKRSLEMLSAALLMAVGACGGSGGGGGGGGGGDSSGPSFDVAGDSALPDAAGPEATASDAAADATPSPVDSSPLPDGAQQDAVAADTAQPDTSGGEYGFTFRLPQPHSIECSDSSDSIEQPDVDWLCTFDHGAVHGHVYVQSTPVDCVSSGMSSNPVFDSAGWISVGSEVSVVDEPSYDWGGNHNNDYMELNDDGSHYKYYHSSFGFGWRKCQPMDCLQVYSPGMDLLEDGCTPERTLPAVCVQIKADGTHDPLDDNFEKCPGDPNG